MAKPKKEADINSAIRWMYGYSEYLREKEDYEFADQLRKILRRLGYTVINNVNLEVKKYHDEEIKKRTSRTY